MTYLVSFGQHFLRLNDIPPGARNILLCATLLVRDVIENINDTQNAVVFCIPSDSFTS